MKHVPAKEAKDGFGLLLDTAQREPVTIDKKGRPVAVVLSIAEFERLQALEEAWWAKQADAALRAGFIGKKASERLLRDLLNAED